MLGLYVCIGRQRTRRFAFAKPTVTIGSAETNDLVLRDGKVEPFHCALISARDRWVVSTSRIEETDLSPAALERMSPLGDGAQLAVGDYTVVIAFATPRDEVERDLLAALVAGDAASRLVYADWLETRGDLARAEYLRLQETLAGIDPTDAAVRLQFKDQVSRLRELAWTLDIDWRQAVGRPAVENCKQQQARFDFKCKMDWGTLAPTDRPDVRRCHGCGDDVYYSATLREARAHAEQGRCVALELLPDRKPDDLRSTMRHGTATAGMFVPR